MVNKGWLYGLLVFLAQTCNPHFNANNNINERFGEIEIPDSALELEDDFIIEPPRTAEPPEVKIFEEDFDVTEVPPPPPPRIPKREESIFMVVEEMPRFPGCEGQGLDKNEVKFCAEKKMLEFIYGNLKYPEEARKNGVEGLVVMSFYVDKDGTLKDIKVLRDPGAGCGAEAIRILEMMNEMPEKWTPGKQRGKPVKVKFTLPIRFRL